MLYSLAGKNGHISFLHPFDYNYNSGQHYDYARYSEMKGIPMRRIVRHYMGFGRTQFGPFMKPWQVYFRRADCEDSSRVRVFENDMAVWWSYAAKVPELYKYLRKRAVTTTVGYYLLKPAIVLFGKYKIKRWGSISYFYTNPMIRFHASAAVSDCSGIQCGRLSRPMSIFNNWPIPERYGDHLRQ